MSQNHNELDLAFREHGAFLRRIALALTSDPWEAEDATQEAFLAATRQETVNKESMRAWLATVLRRSIQKRRRSETRRERREASRAQAESCSNKNREELFRNLAELVAVLPLDDRRLLIRRYWEGLNAREIADQDGLSKSTVESRIRRALEALRLRMDEKSDGNRSAWALAILAPTTQTVGLGWKEGILLMSIKKVTGGAVVTLLLFLALYSLGVFETDEAQPLPSASESAQSSTAPDVRRSSSETADLVGPEKEGEGSEQIDGRGTAFAVNTLGGLNLKLRTSDGQVAANRVVLATALDREIGLVEVATTTDGTGVARFKGLPEGRHELVCPRGGQRTARVVAGQLTEFEWQLYAAPSLSGRVLDEAGLPIAGATIHLSLAVDPNHFAAAALSADDGRFHLEDVDSSRLVVTAKGFEPSSIIELADEGRQPLLLTMKRGGTSLNVQIIDENSQPVAHAWCRIVDPSVSESRDNNEAPASSAEAPGHHQSYFGHQLRSDAQGRLCVDGLGSERLTIEARAPGYQGRSLRVEGDRADIEQVVMLWPEHRLQGRILGEENQGLPDVRVSCGSYRGLNRFRGLTNQQGEFEVCNLGSGRRVFEVDAGDRGKMKRNAEISSEAVTEVSWTLDPGLSLRAQVLDDANAPVAGLRVRARPLEIENSVTWRDAKTDANGRFKLTSVDAVPQLIEFYDPAQMEQPIHVVKGLKPSAEEQRIILGERDRANSYLIGRVVNDSGEALPDAEIVIFGENTMAATSRPVEADGSFRYGPFGSGRLTVMISAEGLPEITRVLQLERDQDFNLGDLVLPRPGRAIAKLLFAANTERGTPSGSVVSLDARSFDCRFDGNRCISPPLAPGRYTFRVWTARNVEAARVIEVKSGEDSVFDLNLEPGAPTRICFDASQKSRMPEEFRVRVTREDGEEFLDRRHQTKAGYDFQIFQVLPVGRYVFSIENNLGMHREQVVTLSSPGQPEVTITLDLTE